MKKIVLMYGSIAGGIMVIMFFGMRFILGENADYSAGEWIGYTTMIIALSLIFVGIKKYRDTNAAGIISFGKAFQVGLLITLVASLIYVFGWLLYSSTMDPDFADRYFDQQVEQLKASGEPEQVIQEQIQAMENFREMYKNPFIQLGFSFLEIFPVGLLITLICSILLKKKQ